MKIKEIAACLEDFAPKSLQESYDNSGLLLGDPNDDVQCALICLDLTMEVLDEAIQGKCDLIISHHPLIFSGLKSLTGKNDIERIIIQAIKNDIAVYAIHTNLDNMQDGVNAMLCEKLGVVNTRILKPLHQMLSKLVTFCPVDHADKVREELFASGAGHIGNYDSCSFNSEGYGTFRAGEGTDPYVGDKGKEHREKEVRIEMIFPQYLQGALISSLMAIHPYEEVAYDIYQLSNEHSAVGAGMIGELKNPMDEMSFIKHVKDTLSAGCIRHTKPLGKMISKVAVCGGSGSFLIKNAIKSGADIFITADVKYHQFFEAEERILIADAGHFETEQFTKELIYNILIEKFPTFALRISHTNTNAIYYL